MCLEKGQNFWKNQGISSGTRCRNNDYSDPVKRSHRMNFLVAVGVLLDDEDYRPSLSPVFDIQYAPLCCGPIAIICKQGKTFVTYWRHDSGRMRAFVYWVKTRNKKKK